MSSVLNITAVPNQAPPVKPPVYSLYIDDSGARALDRLPSTANQHPRWFALGGFIVAEIDEAACKAMYDDFYATWPQLTGPLHLTDMRAKRSAFAWLNGLSSDRFKSFGATIEHSFPVFPWPGPRA